MVSGGTTTDIKTVKLAFVRQSCFWSKSLSCAYVVRIAVYGINCLFVILSRGLITSCRATVITLHFFLHPMLSAYKIA